MEELKDYLNKRIEQLKKHKPKSYTNKIRKHECQYLLNEIEKIETKKLDKTVIIDAKDLAKTTYQAIHDITSKD